MVPAYLETSTVCVAISMGLTSSGPPAKKLVRRFLGPLSRAVGKPPVAPYWTAVKLVPCASVQPGTGTTLPSVEPSPFSAAPFLIKLFEVPACATPGRTTTRAADSTRPPSRIRPLRDRRARSSMWMFPLHQVGRERTRYSGPGGRGKHPLGRFLGVLP